MVDPTGSVHSLYPGDLVLIDPEAEIYAGCIVFAQLGSAKSEVYCLRKVQIRKPGKPGKRPVQVALVPLNPDHHTEVFPGDVIYGVMVGMYRRPVRP